MMIKMCLIEFLKIFLVKMKIGNNHEIKIIKSRLKTGTSVKWKCGDNEYNFKQT